MNQKEHQIASTKAFTTDFFANAFSDTIQDNSFDLSRQLLKPEMQNKSQILLQIKKQAIQKMCNLLLPIQVQYVFMKLKQHAIIMARRNAKNENNITKVMFKMALLFELKTRSRLEMSLIKINQFTKKYNMAQYEPPHYKKGRKFISAIEKINQILKKTLIKETFYQIQQYQKLLDKLQIFNELVSQVLKIRPLTKHGMSKIKNHHNVLNRAEFLYSAIEYLFRNKMRLDFTILRNHSISNLKQLQIQDNPQSKIKISKVSQNIPNYQAKQVNGLSFKKSPRFKKRASQISSNSNRSNRPKQEITDDIMPAKNIAIDLMRTQEIVNHNDYPLKSNIAHGYKRQFPTKIENCFIDKIIRIQNTDMINIMDDLQNIQRIQRTYKEPIITTNRTYFYGQKNVTSRLNTLTEDRDNKKNVLSFSSAKPKSRKKKSILKSQTSLSSKNQPKTQRRQPQEYNIQSMKSYYFPEKTERIGTSSNKWLNESLRNKLCQYGDNSSKSNNWKNLNQNKQKGQANIKAGRNNSNSSQKSIRGQKIEAAKNILRVTSMKSIERLNDDTKAIYQENKKKGLKFKEKTGKKPINNKLDSQIAQEYRVSSPIRSRSKLLSHKSQKQIKISFNSMKSLKKPKN